MEEKDFGPLCEHTPEMHTQCDCYRLSGQFPLGEGEVMPDHVGEQAMRMSCFLWLSKAAELPFDNFAKVVLPLGNGMITEPVTVWDWPVPIMNSDYQLILVLRQWVEEEPDPMLLKLLEEESAWQGALQRIRAHQGVGVELILRACGLPHTPGTVRYVDALMWDTELPPGPTRGVLVTSLVLQSRPEVPKLRDQVISQILCCHPWTTDALRRRAGKLAAEHARWWSGVPQSRFVEMDLRRLNRRGPDELTEDVQALLRGELSLVEVEERTIARERELKGSALTPLEKREVLRKVRRRVKDEEQRRGG